MGNRGRNDSSSESDDWEDESWIVDCPCGVNYDDGEEMVECDECGVWVHTACCRVPKLLPSYVCDKCKKKQIEEESEVAQLLADLPGKPVSFEEQSVPRAELFTPFRVPNNLPTEAKAHVTGIPGGDPSFFVGAPKIFGRRLWTYSGYVPKRFNVAYNQLGDPREGTAELLRDLPNVVVPLDIDERLKRLARVQENGRENPGNCQGSLQVCAEAPTPNLREVTSAELLTDETLAQDVTPKGKQVKSNRVKKVDVKVEGKIEGKVDVKAEGEAEGKPKHRHKSKVKDEKSHSHAKRSREEVGLKEHISKKKIRVRGDAVKVEDSLDTVSKLEVVLETDFTPVTHAVSQTSPKNPKAMKKLAVQEFMHGVLKICSRCRGTTPVPLSCGRTFYLSEWTCQKCGSLEGGTRLAGLGSESGLLEHEPGASTENVGICSDVGTVDRKSGETSDAAVKTPRSREDGRQICFTVDCPSSNIHGKESDGIDFSADLKAPDAEARQPHWERAWESGELVNFQELETRLESPGKRTKRVDLEKEAGEILEASDTSEHRASKSHSLLGEAGEELASEVCHVNSVSESKFSPSNDVKSVAGANKNSGSVWQDPQVEKKILKLQATSTISETRGQGSARTSGCLPASVREKFSQQQQRAVSGSVGALQHASSGQSPGQTPVYSAQKVVSPLSAGAASGVTSTKVCQNEDSGSLQAQALGHQEGSTQVSKQLGRSVESGSEGIQKSPEGPQDVCLLSQSSLSVQRFESESIHRAKGELGEAKEPIRIEGESPVGNCQLPVLGSTFSVDTQEQKVSLPPCQQARQSNGVGTYSRKSSAQVGGSASHSSEKTTSNVRMATSTKGDSKVLGGQMKSPLSSGTSSSPTSPLVTTPSSKVQPHSSKASGSPPPQKSLSGGTTPKSSSVPMHGGAKVPTSGTSSTKQFGPQHTSKSVPTLSPTPLSSKAVNMGKQSSKSSLPVSKSGDVSIKTSGAVTPSRGGNHGGPAKDTAKSASQSNSKVSAAGKVVPHSTVTKPPSSSKHSHGMTKAASLSGQNKQHSGSSKTSLQALTKPAAAQHSKTVPPHKDEKSSMPPAPPAPKAMSTMPPPPPQIPAKRSPPAVLTSPATTTLKDEELALLLHQELNSSPRVPRVPRARQAGAALQLTSVSHISSVKGTTGSASSAGGSHKLSVEHHLVLRRRTREDRHSIKDGDRNIGKTSAEEASKAGVKKADDGKNDDGRSTSDSTAVNISLPDGKESTSVLGSQSLAEGNARHHLLGRGNLSIIVPGEEDVPDGEKSPDDGSVVTLQGLIEEVMNSKGHQVSYEDVCEAILPHWPNLRKLNGERYSYSSHRQAVLESLRSRPAWAHLVDRTKGLQTYVARKRRRNESTTLSDSESDPVPNGLEHHAYDGLKALKRSKVTEGEKGDVGSSSIPKNSADVSKGKRRVRRRRRLAMDDGTDGEDEPRTRTENDIGTNKAAAVSQEDEPESISSPSSEEAVSNYSEEDEEMVVHRGMRNRRRRGDDSTCSEDDMD